jgi:hypothetical protein
MDPEVLAEVRGIRKALERIADALDSALVIPPAPAEPEGCPHPVEQRIDFGETNGQPDWQCGVKDCGYRSIGGL